MGHAASVKHKSPLQYSYESAVVRTNARVKSHMFDGSTIEVLRDDVKKFMDYLHSGFLA